MGSVPSCGSYRRPRKSLSLKSVTISSCERKNKMNIYMYMYEYMCVYIHIYIHCHTHTPLVMNLICKTVFEGLVRQALDSGPLLLSTPDNCSSHSCCLPRAGSPPYRTRRALGRLFASLRLPQLERRRCEPGDPTCPVRCSIPSTQSSSGCTQPL